MPDRAEDGASPQVRAKDAGAARPLEPVRDLRGEGGMFRPSARALTPHSRRSRHGASRVPDQVWSTSRARQGAAAAAPVSDGPLRSRGRRLRRRLGAERRAPGAGEG